MIQPAAELRTRRSPLKVLITLSLLTFIVAVGFVFIAKPSHAAAATANGCTVPSGGGTDSFDQANTTPGPNGINVPATGTYYLWLHMESPDGTHNSLQVSIDGGACITIGTTMSANTWTWVTDVSGSTSASFYSLTAGYHTMVVTGANGVSLDSFLLTQQTPSQCTPTGTTSATDCQPALPVTVPYYLAAGNPSNVVTGSGSSAITWNSDTLSPTINYVTTANTDTNCQLPAGQTIANAAGLQQIYACERWGTAAFTYTIPVANGSYDVKLLFAEINPSETAAGDRVFSASVDGTTVGANIDLVKLVGQYAAYIINDPVTVANGQITVTLTPGSANAPKISGIEILPPDSPSVSISAPTANSTVAGPVTLTAAVSDSANTIKSVQFQVDGANVGSAITTSPYTTTWQSTTATNAAHSITAIATNSAGTSTTSNAISVTVANNTCTGTPQPPSGVSETATASTVTLSWQAGSAAANCTLAGYNIYRGTSATNLTKINTSPVTGLTYPDTTVSAGTTYYYQVTAVDSTGSAPESAKAPTTPLSATTSQNCSSNASTKPSTPTLTAVGGNQYTSIALSWTASTVNNGCTLSGYHLYRGTTLIYTGTAANFVDTGIGLTPANLQSGTTYSYSVQAYDSGSNNSTAGTASATTKADNEGPTEPTGLTGTPTNSSTATLTWTGSTDQPNPGGTGIGGYYVYKNDNLTTPYATITNTSSGTITWSDTVSPATTNKYAVAAFDKATPPNPSVITADVSVTTPSAPANCSTTTKPATPTGLTSTATLTSITVNWTAVTPPTGCTITSYEVVDSSSGTPVTVSSPTYTLSGITPGSYSFSIIAIDSSGVASTATTATSFSTLPETAAPGTPTNFKATAPTSTGVNLSWTASTDTVGITKYVLTRGSVVTTLSGTATSYTDTSVSPGQSYSYSLVAYNYGTTPSAAATTTVSVPASGSCSPPSSPTGLATSAISSTQVVLGWSPSTADTSAGCSISGYEVLNNGNVVSGTSLVSGTSYTVSGLQPDTNQSFTVIAVDSSKDASLASAALPVTTLGSTGCTTTLVADVNHDCHVNLTDLALFIQDYLTYNGQAVTPSTNGDVNGDGKVNFNDLGSFSYYYPIENGQ